MNMVKVFFGSDEREVSSKPLSNAKDAEGEYFESNDA